MKLYYPETLLRNCEEGLNLIPLVKVEGEENRYKVNLEITPFANYKETVIEISDPAYINTDKAVELTSYVVCQHDGKWVLSKDLRSQRIQFGLLKYLVNRAEETREITYRLNALKVASGEYSLAVLGFIYNPDENQCIFLLRYDFTTLPEATKKEEFIEVTPAELLSDEFRGKHDMDKLSKSILDELALTLPAMPEPQ